MSERFFCDMPISGPEVVLAGAEAHHLMHVMRAGEGDQVVLFDNSGAEFEAEVASLSRREVVLAILQRHEIDREAACRLTMGVALPKGDRQKVLVEKLTELGVARLTPLVTDHGGAKPSEGAIEKLRRQVIESSKQCGRNRLMTIDNPTPLSEFLAETQAAERLFVHPSGAEEFGALDNAPSVAIAIGPEGGFSDAECETATAQGWRAIALGSRILRIETAAIGLAFSVTQPG